MSRSGYSFGLKKDNPMFKHGMTKSPTHNTWVNMRRRCYDVSRPTYKNYGGRGIKVCKRWENFQNFIDDMGQRPEGQTLDRINVDGDYKKSNCRWATAKQQAMNKKCYSATGVKHLYKCGNGFSLQIRREGKIHYLGYFKTIDLAKKFIKTKKRGRGVFGLLKLLTKDKK